MSMTFVSLESIRNQFVVDLFEADILHFKETRLTSGRLSPIYFNPRLLASHPRLLKHVSALISAKICELSMSYDVVCSSDPQSTSLTTAFAVSEDVPALFARRDVRDDEDSAVIDGHCKRGAKALVIAGSAASGRSVSAAVDGLVASKGADVKDVVSVIDMNQGATSMLKDRKVELHACLHIDEIMGILESHGKMNKSAVNEVRRKSLSAAHRVNTLDADDDC